MSKLKTSLYALEHPQVPGLYYRLDGETPRLTVRERACLAPATSAGLTWIAERAQRMARIGVDHQLVRLDS